MSNVFSGVSAVPGSFTNYTIQIDLSNGNVIAADLTGQLVLPIIGAQSITQTATSTEVAGFMPTDLFGIEYPAHCTGGGGCTIVPGSGYDIATGQVNAVGTIATLVQVFSPFGDMRFTELPAEPFCDVEMTQAAYVDGDVTELSVVRFANFGGADLIAQLLVELKFDTAGFTGTAFDAGSDGSLVLATGFDVDFGPSPVLPVTSGLPRGTWAYRCAIVDPVSGDVLAEDTAEFEIQSAPSADFAYNGQVLVTTGAMVGLIPTIPLDMIGNIAYEPAAIAAGLAGPSDVTAMEVNIDQICIAIDISTCAPGTIATPITSIDAAAITFAGGLPTGGSMTVTGNLTSPVALTLTVVFDFDAGTWDADAGVFGTVGGTFAPTLP